MKKREFMEPRMKKREFMDAYNEYMDLLHSCLPRTKRFWKQVDRLFREQQSFLIRLALWSRE